MTDDEFLFDIETGGHDAILDAIIKRATERKERMRRARAAKVQVGDRIIIRNIRPMRFQGWTGTVLTRPTSDAKGTSRVTIQVDIDDNLYNFLGREYKRYFQSPKVMNLPVSTFEVIS